MTRTTENSSTFTSRNGRGRRVAAMALGGVLVTGLAGACGSDDGGGGSGASDGSKGDSGSQGLSSQDTRAVQSAYDKTSDAKTAKVKLNVQVSGQGQQAQVEGSGGIDLSKGNSMLTLETQGQKTEQRTLDGMLYQKLPPSQRKELGHGKPWVKLDLTALSGKQSGQMQDPAQSFDYLKGLDGKDVTKVGTETVDGAKTTHYRLTLDVAKLVQGKGKLGEQMKQQLGKHIPVDAWLDGDGRVRQEKVALTVKPESSSADPTASGSPGSDSQKNGPIKTSTTVKFSDFGTDVKVTAPPASDTTDLTKNLPKTQ